MTNTLPKTQNEMRDYLQSALELEDACLAAQVAKSQPVASQREREASQVVAQAAKILSIIWLNMSEQPELTDLARVHKVEGDGEAVCTWMFVNEQEPICCFILDIRLYKPVQASFHTTFLAAEWYVLLDAIAQHGAIWIVPGPAPDWQRWMRQMNQEAFRQAIEQRCGSGVVLTLNPSTMQELAEHVRAWKARFAHLL